MRGLPVISTVRMKRFKEELPLVMINTEKSEERNKLFNLTEVTGIKTKVETKRKPTSASQCFRCQSLGMCNTDVQQTAGV